MGWRIKKKYGYKAWWKDQTSTKLTLEKWISPIRSSFFRPVSASLLIFDGYRMIKSKIETNHNPGHNHFRSQIKFKQYMNWTDNMVKQNNADRTIAIWLCINRMIFELVKSDMEYNIITVMPTISYRT